MKKHRLSWAPLSLTQPPTCGRPHGPARCMYLLMTSQSHLPPTLPPAALLGQALIPSHPDSPSTLPPHFLSRRLASQSSVLTARVTSQKGKFYSPYWNSPVTPHHCQNKGKFLSLTNRRSFTSWFNSLLPTPHSSYTQ